MTLAFCLHVVYHSIMQTQTVNAALSEVRKIYRRNIRNGMNVARAADSAMMQVCEKLEEPHGISFLEYANGTFLYMDCGDPYPHTIMCYLSVYGTVRFTAGNWGDLAEKNRVW